MRKLYKKCIRKYSKIVIWKSNIVNILILAFFSCGQTNYVDSRVENSLQEAGKNKNALIKVLDHYRGDSLKFEAAVFLISNMYLNYSEDYQYYDGKGNERSIDFRKYTLDEVKKIIEEEDGEFRLKKRERDINIITSDYLIKNIDLSFKIWKKYKWSQQVNFDEFCEKILPYRVSNGPLRNWREYYYAKHRKELDSLDRVGASMKDVVFWINTKHQKEYVPSTSIFPGSFAYEEFEKIGGGNCNHLAQDAVKVMRACGVPLNFDVLTYHGRINGGHVYNSFRIPSTEEFHFFSPYDRKPERREWRSPKVMRRLNRIQSKEIYDYLGEFNLPNELYMNPLFTDVTNEYFPVMDLKLEVVEPKGNELLYLCTYNRAKFHSVAWSRPQNGKYEFKNLTKELLYFPMSYRSNSYVSSFYAFILRDSGDAYSLVPNYSERIDIVGVKVHDVNKNITMLNKKYKVYYWDNAWFFFDYVLANDDLTLSLKNLPKNTLYRIAGESDTERIQRPFTCLDGKIEYW